MGTSTKNDIWEEKLFMQSLTDIIELIWENTGGIYLFTYLFLG